jgi:hypothetical protein
MVQQSRRAGRSATISLRAGLRQRKCEFARGDRPVAGGSLASSVTPGTRGGIDDGFVVDHAWTGSTDHDPLPGRRAAADFVVVMRPIPVMSVRVNGLVQVHRHRQPGRLNDPLAEGVKVQLALMLFHGRAPRVCDSRLRRAISTGVPEGG